MKLTDGEVVKLSNNKEYICVKTFILDAKDYMILMGNFRPLEIKFAQQIIEGDKVNVRLIENQEEKVKIMEFMKDLDLEKELKAS